MTHQFQPILEVLERGEVLCEVTAANMLREVIAAPEPDRVFIVATGETHDGHETYTRYQNYCPPFCDSEMLYSAPHDTEALRKELEQSKLALSGLQREFVRVRDERDAMEKDAERLAYVYSGQKTGSNALVNIELRLINDDVPTIDEVRLAIDAAIAAQGEGA